MNKFKYCIVLCVFFAFVLLLNDSSLKTVNALSCVIPEIEDSYKNADVVVIGEIIDFSYKEDDKYKFLNIKVEESLKNYELTKDILVVKEDSFWGEGYLNKNKKVLLFLTDTKTKEIPLELPLCTTIVDTEDDMNKIKEISLNELEIPLVLDNPDTDITIDVEKEVLEGLVEDEEKEKEEKEKEEKNKKPTKKENILMFGIILSLSVAMIVAIMRKK